MIDFTGFASGYQKRGDYNQGKRREMAEAFAKFKADNPYATQADFQSFIDQYSGGRNYIAGGAPSSEILASLSENNLRAKQLNEANQNLDMFNKQTDVKNKLTGLIEEKLLSLKPDNNGQIDYVKAADEFRNEYGMLMPEGDNIFTDGMGFTGRFNDAKRNLLVSKQIQEFMPMAKNLIQSSNGKISDNALQMMGVPPQLLAEVKSQTEKAYKQDQQSLQATRKMTLLEQATSMIDRGMPNIIDNLKGIARAYNMDVDSPEANAYFKDIEKQALEVQSNKKQDRANILNDRRAEIKISFRKALQDDALFVNAIRTGNQAEAKRRIMYLTQDYQPETKEFLISAGDALVSDFETSLQLQQTDLLGDKRNKVSAAANVATQGYQKANVARATAHFGKIDKTNPNANGQFGNATLAAQDIALQYDMTGGTLVLLQDVFAQQPPGSNREVLKNAGLVALQANGATNVTQAKQKLENSTILSQGGFGRPETFENWKKTTSDTITKHFTSVDSQLDKIMAMPMQTDADKQKVVRQLNHLQSVSMQGVNAITQNIGFAEKFSIGKDTWITYGTPQWDGTKVQSELTDVMKNKFTQMTSVIKAALEEANTKQVSASSSPNILAPDSSKPSVLSQWWDKTVSDIEAKRKLMQTQTGAGQTSSIFGQTMNDPDTVKKNEIVSLFMQAPGLKDALIKSPSELQKFNSDPFNYIYTSDLGKKWLDSAGKDYKDYRLQ